MKALRVLAVCLIAALMIILLCACGNQDIAKSAGGIVCLAFPEYDWTRNILGDNPGKLELKLLVGNGVDMHSYQPAVDDIAQLSACDLLICTGGSSEDWVLDAIENNRDKSKPALVATELLSEQLLCVGETQHEHDHAHTDIDEHLWLSLNNAQKICEAICAEICSLDPANASIYKANLQSYTQKLQALDNAYAEVVENAVLDSIIVADRFPFVYLAADYGLQYHAAFSGCSADIDASFETIVALTETVDSLQPPAILIIDGSTREIADAVLANIPGSSCEVLTLNSMQSVTAAQLTAGISYIGIMQQNLDVLTRALNP